MQQLKFAISLAQRAGKLVSGDMGVEKALLSRKAKLLIIATDAAPSTQATIGALCEKYSIPIYREFTKAELGMAIGKSPRACIALTDKNFVIMVEKYMKK